MPVLIKLAIAFGTFTLLAAAISTCEAQAPTPLSLKGLYPPCGQIGTEIEVALRSDPPTWPLKVWTDREGIVVSCREEKGQLHVQIKEDATPGTYWVRFYDAQGVSELLPFYVDSCPQQQEVEPNERPTEGTAISLPGAVVGRLEKRGDVDIFRVKLQAEQRLTAVLFARLPLGSPMDAVMQICDQEGRVIDQNDDERGIDPQLSFIAPRDGDYLVRLFAFPETANSTIGYAGDESYIYRLELSSDERFEMSQLAEETQPTQPSLSYQVHPARRSITLFFPNRLGVLEVSGLQINRRWLEVEQPVDGGSETASSASEPVMVIEGLIRDDVANETPIRLSDLPVEVWEKIDEEGGWDRYRVQLSQNERIAIRVQSRSLLQQLDPIIAVLDESGKELARQDDQDRDNRDLDWIFQAPADGVYEIRIGDATSRTGERFAYRLQLQPVTPGFDLTVANDRLLMSVDQKIKVEVTVNRRHDHSGPITISAADLPMGVTCAPVLSEMKSEQEKKVTLEFSTDRPIEGQVVRIVGKDETGHTSVATFSLPQDLRQHDSLWIAAQPETSQ